MNNAAPVAAAGPAGAHFEGQVGAHYLLTMLAGGAPRGLPGTIIDSVAFQRADDHPLDDVVVRAHDAVGHEAILEIQVKRSIRFTAGDAVFADVVKQVVNASKKPGFWQARRELAVATARTSRKTDGPYQDALKWARELGSATIFFSRLTTKGAASNDIRAFVEAFRLHVEAAGGAFEDEAIWKLLQRFQILVFDYSALHSANEELAAERAARVLHPDDSAKTSALWKHLVELAIASAANGGERDKAAITTDLREFRLAGDPRNLEVRKALAASARDALADISDRVGDVQLARTERIASVHDALDRSRYVEIRGDAGVGKSAILKHFVAESGIEAGVVVLAPNRTIPRGWLAMRGALGFEGGGAENLLSDLAADGAAILFIDNLDGFSREERPTVIDLIRAASRVPGVAVIATCRRNFGAEEPSWLPTEAVERLGSAPTVVIDELSDAEVEELSASAPRLAALLADVHPARNVVRNLYRLARLARRSNDDGVPRTEVEMAEEWWRTADGESDNDSFRERSRTLRLVAEQIIAGAEVADVASRPARSVTELVSSETLAEIRTDIVTFRHDVLREWAIANLINEDLSRLVSFSTTRPTTSALARGVEIAARMRLERSADVREWQILLETLSKEGIHRSWPRAALLALVRSEIGYRLLSRAKGMLFADGGTLLRELIRTVAAVDVEPISQVLAASGQSAADWPAGMYFPSGPSWHRLIRWLIKEKANLPAEALPDVVDIFGRWSRALFCQGDLTPQLQAAQFDWLSELEAAYGGEFSARYKVFGGKLETDVSEALLNDLRLNFKLCSARTPDLAKQYLALISGLQHDRTATEAVIEFRGTLAQAAPEELAELTATALINTQPRRRRDRRDLEDQAFHFLDHKLHPAAPAQGPFLELLNSAPEIGIALIRRIVRHAVEYDSDGQEPGTDAFLIDDGSQVRTFPRQDTYLWSRGHAGSNAVGSALMALEAWAHQRIEAGDTVQSVLDRVLKDGDPAAFVLVAVDIIISHWPKSKEAAVPYLACPELLCADRTRPAQENFEFPDFFGLKALEREPVGSVTRKSLKERPSRRIELERLIGAYAVYGPEEARGKLVGLLRKVLERLGPPELRSNFGDPRFMAIYAINLADPENYREREASRKDGTKTKVFDYISPPEEQAQILRFQSALGPKELDFKVQNDIGLVIEDSAQSSAQLAEMAAEWAKRQPPSAEDGPLSMRDQNVLAAAMIAMRDGSPDLRADCLEWAIGVFESARRRKDDGGGRMRRGIRYNPAAIAFVGLTHVLRHENTPQNQKRLLVVATSDASAGRGFQATASIIAEIDERLPRSILRCAFAANVRLHRRWDLKEEDWDARQAARRERVQGIIDSELRWLSGEDDEPGWPYFPTRRPNRRRGFRLPGGPSGAPELPRSETESFTDHQGAAIWLHGAVTLAAAHRLDRLDWLRSLLLAYASWTSEANGLGMDSDAEPSNLPQEWNGEYFALLANSLEGLLAGEVDQFTIEYLRQLPDRPFYDAITSFVRSLDVVYFGRGQLISHAARIRSGLAAHLMQTAGWKRLSYRRSQSSIEMHIGPAIAVMFFNDYYSFGGPPQCYLNALGVSKSGPFLETLIKLNESEQSFLQAMVTLNFLEVQPTPDHLDLAISSAWSWAKVYSENTNFWVDHGIGRRLCDWLDSILSTAPELFVVGIVRREILDKLLATLVSLGVPEARRLEMALMARDG
ncbi:hypothetical protein [Bradyrhizobium sp. USDA 313]|uniref:hypothetical protein n=1 Tax=Bradyrhizobium sp. USDA 313 TaxID=3156307 RepID=UPI003513C839